MQIKCKRIALNLPKIAYKYLTRISYAHANAAYQLH